MATRAATKTQIDTYIDTAANKGRKIDPVQDHRPALKLVLDESFNKTDDNSDSIREGSTKKFATRDNVFDLIKTNAKITKDGNLIEFDIPDASASGSGNPILQQVLSFVSTTPLSAQQAPLFQDTGDAEPDWTGNASYLIFYIERDENGNLLQNTRIVNQVRGNQIRDGLKVKTTSDRPSSTGVNQDFVIQDPSNTARYIAKSAASGGNILFNNAGQTSRFEFRIFRMVNSSGLPSSIDDFTDLADTPDNIVAGQSLRGNATGDALEFFSPPSTSISTETVSSLNISQIARQWTDSGEDLPAQLPAHSFALVKFRTRAHGTSVPGFTTATILIERDVWNARTNVTAGSVSTNANILEAYNNYTGSLDQIEIALGGATDGSLMFASDNANELITQISVTVIQAVAGSSSTVTPPTPPAAGAHQMAYTGSQNSNSFAGYDEAAADNSFDVQAATYSFNVTINVPGSEWGYIAFPTDRAPTSIIDQFGNEVLTSFTLQEDAFTVTVDGTDYNYSVRYFQNQGRTSDFRYVVSKA